MGKSSIEDKIRDRLLGHEVEVDNDALYESLGISERSEKKRKLIFWLLSFGAVAIVISIFFIANNNPVITDASENVHSESTAQIETLKSKNVTANQNELEKFEETSQIESEGIQENDVQDSNISYEIKSENVKQQIVVKESQENRLSEMQVANKEIVNAKPVEIQNEILANETSIQLAVSNDFIEKEINIIEKKAEPRIEGTLVVSAPEEVLEVDEKAHIKVSVIEEEQVVFIENIDSKKSSIAIENPALEVVDQVERSTFTEGFVGSQNLEMLTFNKDLFVGPLEEVDPPNEPSPWAISIMFGYGTFEQNLEGDRENEDYISFKMETETPLEYLELGLSAKYYFARRLYISAGLRFNQYNTKHEYSESVTTMKDVEGITRIDINLLGDTIGFQNGLIEGTEMIRRYYTNYNSINQWTIPVELGIEFTKNRWFVRGAFALNTSIWNSYDGNFLLDPKEIPHEKDFIKNSFTFNIQPLLGIGYSVTDYSSFALMGNYNQTIGSLWNDKMNIVKQNNGYGLRVVYDYRF